VLLKRTPNDGTVSIVVENFRKPKQLAFDKDNRLPPEIRCRPPA